MSTVAKGNKLEDKFYDYLCDQKRRGAYVYGAHPPSHCKIYKKKKYTSKTREGPVEFDIVIEVYAENRNSPYMFVVFECKNHNGSIPDIYVNDFTSKLADVFPGKSKGVMVISTRLQSGAEKTARNRGLGIVKYDENGLDIIADRKGAVCGERRFVETQIFNNQRKAKSLKFSAYYDGNYFSTLTHFMMHLDSGLLPIRDSKNFVPFIKNTDIQNSAKRLLEKIGYENGAVDLHEICSLLSIELIYLDHKIHDDDNRIILGSANFDEKSIWIYDIKNEHRKRFTVAHEIGHICLRHDRYLRSETIAETDLFSDRDSDSCFNYERLEIQANAFASELLLPRLLFKAKTAEYRGLIGYKDRGHGYIYVDDQIDNLIDYNILLTSLSDEFEVSKQVVELKFKQMGALTDKRMSNKDNLSINFRV